MDRKCFCCHQKWNVSIKNQDCVYICPDCNESEQRIEKYEQRYPTPSRKFRKNK